MEGDTDHECLHPDVIAGWLSLTRWARILIPTCILILITLVGAWIALRLQVVDLQGDAAHAQERRLDSRDDIRALRTDLVRLERENSLRLSAIQASIVRLETKVEDQSRRSDADTGRGRR